MRVIMLLGNSNCGKTTTFRCLRCKLKNNLGAKETRFDDLQNQDEDFASEMKYRQKSLALFSIWGISPKIF
jgi:ABC-type multidrug transport system ATPase subunit